MLTPVTRTPRRSWVDGGLRALASGGPDAVRVESLAQSLGVTKGGFSYSSTTWPYLTVRSKVGTAPPGTNFDLFVNFFDGTTQTFRRDGDVPKVDVRDPMKGHRDLLAMYTDKDMHDVTAYLVTLK